MAATVVSTEIEGFAQVLIEFIEGKWAGWSSQLTTGWTARRIWFVLSMRYDPPTDTAGRGWSYVLEDITEREHAEEERE